MLFQEYGITKEEKLVIGQSICTPLLKKILGDVQHHEDESSTRLDFRYESSCASDEYIGATTVACV
jgi:inositol-hexakisphosphate/diphosphoinositol-pentakisphosphate 1-kinase